MLSLGVLLMILGAGAMSQKVSAQTEMDLEACIAYGMVHSPTLIKSGYDESIADNDVKIALSSGLPQITGQADIINNFQLPVFVLPGEIGESQSVRFGLPWQSTAGLTANQLIFDGKFFLGLKAAQTLAELTQVNTRRSKEQLAFDISKAILHGHGLQGATQSAAS